MFFFAEFIDNLTEQVILEIYHDDICQYFDSDPLQSRCLID